MEENKKPNYKVRQQVRYDANVNAKVKKVLKSVDPITKNYSYDYVVEFKRKNDVSTVMTVSEKYLDKINSLPTQGVENEKYICRNCQLCDTCLDTYNPEDSICNSLVGQIKDK